MLLLHAIESMSPEGGGPAEVIRRLSKAAADTGAYQTEVATLDPPRPAWWDGQDSFPMHFLGPGVGKYGYSARFERWLENNVSRFDGVIVNGLWQYPGLAVWRACRSKVPYIVYAHGMLDPWFKRAYPWKHLKKLAYWSVVERRVLRDASSVVFTSPLEAELACGTFPFSTWRSTTTPYGTLSPQGDRNTQIESFYRACPEAREKPFLLFLGRIHKKKGCDLLVRAFGDFAAKCASTQLVIAGPDEQGWKPELVAMASRAGVGNRIHFPGMLKGDAKWGAFYAAEAFVLPSHQENFGVAVAEALACGTPVLISNQVNIWKDIEEDGVGLVEPDTLDGTRRLLERWRSLADGARAEMASKCQAAFQRRYDMNQVPKAIARLFPQSR